MHVPSMYQVYTTAGESQNMFCAKTLNCTYIMSECIYTLYTRIHCTHVHTHTHTHTWNTANARRAVDIEAGARAGTGVSVCGHI